MSDGPDNVIDLKPYGMPPGTEPAWVQLLSPDMPSHERVHIHLVGIGGAGLSAIAGLLLDRGYVAAGAHRAQQSRVGVLHGRAG